jgi:hypothetical protein
VINTLLVRWAGGWREVTDAAAVAAHGRHESLLGLGAVASTTEVDWAATQVLTYWVNGQTQISADLRPSSDDDTPYTAFGVGDTVTVPGRTGGSLAERVIALTVAEDDNGELTWAPDLKGVLLSASERFEQALKKMADGTLSGQSKTATPLGAPETKPAAVRPITVIAPPATGGGGAPGSLTLFGYESVTGDIGALTPIIHRISPAMVPVLSWGLAPDYDGIDRLTVTVHADCSLLVTYSGWWSGIAADPGRVYLEVMVTDADSNNQRRAVGPYDPMAMGLLTNSGNGFEVGATWTFACTPNSTFAFSAAADQSHSLEWRASFVLLEATTGPPWPT